MYHLKPPRGLSSTGRQSVTERPSPAPPDASALSIMDTDRAQAAASPFSVSNSFGLDLHLVSYLFPGGLFGAHFVFWQLVLLSWVSAHFPQFSFQLAIVLIDVSGPFCGFHDPSFVFFIHFCCSVEVSFCLSTTTQQCGRITPQPLNFSTSQLLPQRLHSCREPPLTKGSPLTMDVTLFYGLQEYISIRTLVVSPPSACFHANFFWGLNFRSFFVWPGPDFYSGMDQPRAPDFD